MRAEVVAVGTELLLGDIVNTNAAWIGRALADAGIDHMMQVVVGDNEERIAAAIGGALERADAVIVTGGLGPTQDDVTREAIARLTGRALRRDPRIEEDLRARFAAMRRAMPPSNLRQADVPEGAHVIPLTQGTAPGLVVEHGDKVVYAVPGVPSEMEDMLRRAVLPDLRRRAGVTTRIVSRVVRVAGMSESAVAEAVGGTWDRLGGRVTMAFLAGGGEVRIRLTAKAEDDADARAALDDAEAEVRSAIGDAVVGVDEQNLESVCLDLLRARGWSLGCAESLTGGMLGARITSVPGASEIFRGSVVAYASDVKASLLGVAPDALDREGPVSEEVARAMASGARRVLDSDVGLAVTGVAGPSEQGRPVGTVVLAVDGPLGVVVREVRLPGKRDGVRSMATTGALNLLRLWLLGSVG